MNKKSLQNGLCLNLKKSNYNYFFKENKILYIDE